MNEKVAEMGNQFKNAFSKVKDNWNNQEPSRKKLLLIVVLGLIAVAVILTIGLNMLGGRYVPVYEGMPQDEVVEALGVLETAGVPGRINQDTGNLEVPQSKVDAAMGQLAIAGLPSNTLDYDILEKAGGLTTTEFEKRQYATNQMQNRLQDIIKSMDGVNNAYVTLNISTDSNKVWDSDAKKDTASIKVDVAAGNTLTPGQISGIQHLVASATGLAPADVSVVDQNGSLLAAGGEDATGTLAEASQFLQRQGFEKDIEQRYADKVNNILSLAYPNADDFRVGVSVAMDYDAMITESMEYVPQDEDNSGVMNHKEEQATMGAGQYAEGVAGEENNTDVPTYADNNGDGEPDSVDYYQNKDYLVSYIKQQIEKDGAKLAEASIAVLIRGNVTAQTRQTLRESIAAATGRPIEDISVQSMDDAGDIVPPDENGGFTIGGLPALFVYIAAGVVAVLIIAIVLVLVIRKRGRKKQLAAEEAALAAEQEEAERVQREIEERKKQLKNAAAGAASESDNVISGEVKDFAKTNPEITANLLRNWLKEGEG